MNKTIISTTLAVILLSGCASSPSLSEREVMQQYPTVQQASTAISEASADNLSFYSPEQMKQARRVYQEALKDAKAGKTSATGLADEAVKRAQAARKQAEEAKYVFEDVIEARSKALNVNADTVAADDFNDVEEDFSKAIAQLEIGDDDRAKRNIEALKNRYLALELNALKKNMLSVAQDAVRKAEREDLDDVAPRTVAQAKDELKLAISVLEANRNDTAKANVHSNRAIYLVKQARGIAEIDEYFDNADFDEEQKILWYQEQLSTVMSPIDQDVQFDNSNKEVVATLKQKVSGVVNENQMLTANLSDAELAAQQARQRAQDIASESEQRASALERDKQEALMQARMERERELAEKQAADQRFTAVQSMFSDDEATVYRQNDNVLIRAQGFAFKPGTSEIEQSNFSLLNKITDAIKRFPDASVVVSGHTDSTGSAELNQNLSEARAQTVANFITKVSNIDESKVTSKGFGKDKPVASNESAEGRAQNRRVEVLIVNS